jgi:hypothetical protein
MPRNPGAEHCIQGPPGLKVLSGQQQRIEPIPCTNYNHGFAEFEGGEAMWRGHLRGDCVHGLIGGNEIVHFIFIA